MDSSQTIREQLRRRRRRKFWHLVRLLVSTAVLAVTCTYAWRYVHNPAFAFGNVSIHGSSQLTEAEIISLAGCGQGPLNLSMPAPAVCVRLCCMMSALRMQRWLTAFRQPCR